MRQSGKALPCFVVLLVCLTLTPVALGDVIETHSEKVFAEPSPDEAVVYFVRPSFLGKAVKTWAFVDDEPVGANKGKQYTFVTVPPGKHLFWAKAENTSAIELEVEAGETYYLKQAVQMGGLKSRVKLVPIDAAEGEAALKKCKKYTTLTPEGVERGKEIVVNKHETAEKKAATRGES